MHSTPSLADCPLAAAPRCVRSLSTVLLALFATFTTLASVGCGSAATQKWGQVSFEIGAGTVSGAGEARIDLVGVGEADAAAMAEVRTDEYWMRRPEVREHPVLARHGSMPVLRLPPLAYDEDGGVLYVDDEHIGTFLDECRRAGRYHIRVAVDLYGTPEGYLATWLPSESAYWVDGLIPTFTNGFQKMFGGQELTITISESAGRGVIVPVPSFVKPYRGPGDASGDTFLSRDATAVAAAEGGGR